MMIARLPYYVPLLMTWSLIIKSFQTQLQARGPVDITRTEGETGVFIPCPFEFRPAPSIWRINGTDYVGATLPPVYRQTSGGLFIRTVHKCLNHTSFQCIDTSSNSLQSQRSDVGYLTVTLLSSSEKCSGHDELKELYVTLSVASNIELDHQHIVYGAINTTLAWVNPNEDSCNINHVVSSPPCHRQSTIIDIVTNKTEVTVPLENFQISGNLADINISSSAASDQHLAGLKCPVLKEAIRINVTQTKRLELLIGNNDCTCIEIKCQGSLYVTISSPDVSPPDILCSIYVNTPSCYSPNECRQFGTATPFFRICESPNAMASTGCTYSMCFGNITEDLNGTRLDFLILNKTVCISDPVYFARVYVQSFELNVRYASANISVSATTGEICFNSSPQECNFTRFTEYIVSIADLTGNLIFMNDTVPESSCVTIQNFQLPQCYPFIVSTQPVNDFIIYNSVDEMIIGDGFGDMCNCIYDNVQIQIHDITLKNSMIDINYLCSTAYVTKPNIKLIVSAGNETLHQRAAVCSDGTINFSYDQCGQIIYLKGYWTFTNGSTFVECPLSNDSMSLSCPITPPNPPTSNPVPRIIAAALVSLLIVISTISIVTVIIIMIIRRWKKGTFYITMQVKRKEESQVERPFVNNSEGEDLKVREPVDETDPTE